GPGDAGAVREPGVDEGGCVGGAWPERGAGRLAGTVHGASERAPSGSDRVGGDDGALELALGSGALLDFPRRRVVPAPLEGVLLRGPLTTKAQRTRSLK